MKRSNLHAKLIRLLLVIIITAVALQGLFAPRTCANGVAAAPQYDDPYSDFRNVRYSNAGLLSERDDIKLGAQLHREVTKKYNLTDVGLERVDRIGQRCARASLRPSLVYKFHVIQGREINGFSIPGGHVYVTTALLRLANDNELGAVLCHEVGHLVALAQACLLWALTRSDSAASPPPPAPRPASRPAARPERQTGAGPVTA